MNEYKKCLGQKISSTCYGIMICMDLDTLKLIRWCLVRVSELGVFVSKGKPKVLSVQN